MFNTKEAILIQADKEDYKKLLSEINVSIKRGASLEDIEFVDGIIKAVLVKE